MEWTRISRHVEREIRYNRVLSYPICRNTKKTIRLELYRIRGNGALKNKLLVIGWLSLCAITFDPFTAKAVYGVLEKFVDYLFLFFCLTRTLSPSLIPLYFVARRSFAYRFPTYFAFFSFGLLYIGGINLLWKGDPLSDVTLCPDGRGPQKLTFTLSEGASGICATLIGSGLFGCNLAWHAM